MKIYLGKSNGQEIYEDISKVKNICLIGGPGSGKTTYIKRLIYELIDKHSIDELRIMVHDSKKFDYYAIRNSRYLLNMISNDHTMELLRDNFDMLKKIHDERMNSKIEHPAILVFIDDFSLLNLSLWVSNYDIIVMMKHSSETNIHFIIASQSTEYIDENVLSACETQILYQFNSDCPALGEGKSGDAILLFNKKIKQIHQEP